MTLNQIKNAKAHFSRFRKTVSNSSLLAFALLLPMLFAASCAESSSEKADRVGKGGGDANMNQPMTNANNVQPMNNTDGKMADGAIITDIGVYATTADKLSFVNKKAQFDGARVVRVVGPRTFTVASGKDEIYVMLDDESARGVGTQGKIDVGDTVNVAGTFQRLQMDEIKDIKNNRFRALTDAERAFLEKTKLYLQANKVSGSK